MMNACTSTEAVNRPRSFFFFSDVFSSYVRPAPADYVPLPSPPKPFARRNKPWSLALNDLLAFYIYCISFHLPRDKSHAASV